VEGQLLKFGFVLIAAATMLAGCVSAEQIARSEDDQCQTYGYHPHTPELAQCMMALDIARQQNQAAAIANVQRALQNAGNAVGNAYGNMQIPHPIQCNTIATGGGNSSTTCQ
jgi:hypothetical protein